MIHESGAGGAHGSGRPASPAPSRSLLTPGLQARYSVQAELGRGGMGVVYLAHDRQLGVEVALKVLLAAELTKLQRSRFLREGEVTAQLVHPGVVRLLEHGEVEGQPYLSYELIPGARPLVEAAAERALSDRIQLVRDAARALGYAHRRGVFHRDVKPDNLLVGADGRVRVTDFGLAALDGGERMTRTGALVGTPHYMSPEQFAGAKTALVDARADVWALGVVLYQVASGELPFQASTLVELGGAITNVNYLPLSEVAPEAPSALAPLIQKSLARDLEQRYADGEAMAQDLDRYLEGRPAEGRSAGRPARRGTRWPLLLAGLALAGAALAAGQLWLGPQAETDPSREPRPSPSPTSGSPTSSPDDLAGARAEAAAGSLKRALLLASAFNSPEGRTLYVELLLQADRGPEAAAALPSLPPPERARLEALRLLLSGRDPQLALDALPADLGAEASLIRSLATFLQDPSKLPDLSPEWISRCDLVAFARREVVRLEAKARDPSVYLTRAGTYISDLAAARRDVLGRASSSGLWSGHVLERVVRAEIQDALYPVFMIHFVIWSNGNVKRAEWLDDIQLAIDLQPTGPSARRLIRLQHGMLFTIRGRAQESTVRNTLRQVPPDDPRGEVSRLVPADRWFQLLLAFVAHPLPERRGLAEEVLRLRTPQFDTSGQLRRELCLHLARTERLAAYEDLVAGRAQSGREALARAEAAARKQIARILYWNTRPADLLNARDHEEAGLTFLFCGEFNEARAHLAQAADERLRSLYEAEVLLAEGDLRGARKLVMTMARSGEPELPEFPGLVAHLTFLMGRPEEAKALLDKLPPHVESARLPWRGTLQTRALIAGPEGAAWWPGQK